MKKTVREIFKKEKSTKRGKWILKIVLLPLRAPYFAYYNVRLFGYYCTYERRVINSPRDLYLPPSIVDNERRKKKGLFSADEKILNYESFSLQLPILSLYFIFVCV